MDSNEINLLAKQLKINSFLGVFAADQLSNLQQQQKGVLICNTEPLDKSGKHWIGLCMTKSLVMYFDSLNSNFHKSDYMHCFLKKINKPLLKNNIKIQTNDSDKCGIHSLVFCYIISKKCNEDTFTNFLISFSPHKVAQRENLSLNYFHLIA
jgi:hypothetical protein